MAKFRAAVVQDGTSRQGTSTTLEKAEALIAQCVSRGANVAVFPEAFIGGYPKGADFHIYLGAVPRPAATTSSPTTTNP
jgi:nitrilase